MFSKSSAVRLNMVPKSSRCLLVLPTCREDIDAKFVGTSNWFLKRSDIWRLFWEKVVLKWIIAPQCSWSYQTCERLVPFRNSDNSGISDAQPDVIPNKEECLQNCQSDISAMHSIGLKNRECTLGFKMAFPLGSIGKAYLTKLFNLKCNNYKKLIKV